MRQNRRKRNNMNTKRKVVIRCKAQNKPVFEHEVCPKFVIRANSGNQNNCGNCKHAF